MIFLCFAVKDRVPLINDFYQYLQNFGLDVWYDRRNIYLGEDRYRTNITDGVQNPHVNYGIIFYSDNFAKGNICIDEYNILAKRFQEGEIHLFPVFIDDVPERIDPKFQLCKQLVFRTIRSSDDFYRVALHVLAKITQDEIAANPFQTLHELIPSYMKRNNLIYSMLNEYECIEKTNYAMRVASLFDIYSVGTFLHTKNYTHFKTMNYIYHRNCISIFQEEKRELQIMENIVLQELGSLL